MSDVRDLIQNVVDKEYTSAKESFNDLIGEKISDILSQEKIAIADSVFNGIEQVEESFDDDEAEQYLDESDNVDSMKYKVFKGDKITRVYKNNKQNVSPDQINKLKSSLHKKTGIKHSFDSHGVGDGKHGYMDFFHESTKVHAK